MVFKTIKKAIANRGSYTTYQAGLLQNKAFKILKAHTDEALEEYGISTVDWALLGLLYDNKKGMRLIEVANELGVEAPFVTETMGGLEKEGLVEIVTHAEDKRAKLIMLSGKGQAFVPKVEAVLRKHSRQLLQGLSIDDLLTYASVLNMIVRNGSAN